jgi:hypothetical protein
LLQFLGCYTGTPILIRLDSLSTVNTSGSLIRKYNSKQKHFHIDDRFLMQCVEDGTVSIVHVPGEPVDFDSDRGFPVDCLTKPLGIPLFKHYTPSLQGRAKIIRI